jgi:hypothetical protein
MFSKTGTLGTSERAKIAVTEFRRMLPTLSSYARALTGKDDVQVVMSGYDNGSTDGHKIYFRPPIELAEQYDHERAVCDKRDDDGRQRCPSCRLREEILTTIYHEIAHIAFDSFKQPRQIEILRAVEMGFAGRTDRWSLDKSAAIMSAPSYAKNSWMQLAALVSSYFPMLVNCLEDARVNRAMFAARPGIKTMMDADVRRIFTEGFEASDGMGGVRTIKWDEQPLNSQVMVAVFCKVSDYEYTDWFSASVVEALEDDELNRTLRGMRTVRSHANVYTLAIPTLVRLRELGFLLEPDEMESEPEESGEDSESGEGEEPEDAEDAEDTGDTEGEEKADEEADTADDREDSEESDDPESSGPGASEADDSSDDQSDEAGDGTDDDASEGSDREDASVEHSSGSGGDESASAGSAGSEQPTDDELPDGDGGQSDDVGDSLGNESGAGGASGEASGHDADSERAESQGEAASAPVDSNESSRPSTDDASGESSEEADDGDVEFESGDDWQNDEDDDESDPHAVRMIDNPDNDDKPIPEPDHGTPEDAETALLKFGEHDTPPTHLREGDETDAIDVAIIQGIYFETESRNIRGVRFHLHDDVDAEYRGAWENHSYNRDARECDLSTPESILGKALLKARRVFEDNARAKNERNRKNGRVNARSLGRRAPFDDERLFKKRTLPGKKDYCVIIGVDVSGSTVGRNILLEKQAVSAQAELLHRLGVEFAIYAHSGDVHDYSKGRRGGVDLDIYPIKLANEPWDTKSKQRLQDLGSASANLDGHALEFLRKRADESRATDKIILYYSDGQMPAENRDEELVILQREIRTCRTKGYTLLGVGIRTDSPKAHGLDTVRVNEPADLSKVVDHLEKRLV